MPFHPSSKLHVFYAYFATHLFHPLKNSPPTARNFKLLDELEEAEKSIKSDADISLGLSRPDDTFMSDWQASIFCAAVS